MERAWRERGKRGRKDLILTLFGLILTLFGLILTLF